MIVNKKCPYETPKIHYIDVETDLNVFNCPTCGQPILISHVLTAKAGSRKTHGISLHIPRGTPDFPNFKNKIIDYVRANGEKSISDIARAFDCTHGKMWYLLQGMDEVVIEKKGRRCIVGVRG